MDVVKRMEIGQMLGNRFSTLKGILTTSLPNPYKFGEVNSFEQNLYIWTGEMTDRVIQQVT